MGEGVGESIASDHGRNSRSVAVVGAYCNTTLTPNTSKKCSVSCVKSTVATLQ